MTFDFELTLRKACEGFGDLAAAGVERLRSHFDLLVRWNEHLNLTSIRDPELIVQRHFAECVFLCQLVDSEPVLDVGSGGGFPGLVVAALKPHLLVTCLEAHQRKSVFLRECGRSLKNVSVACERLEFHVERYSVSISRGVAWKDLQRCTQAPTLLWMTTNKELHASKVTPKQIIRIPNSKDSVIAEINLLALQGG